MQRSAICLCWAFVEHFQFNASVVHNAQHQIIVAMLFGILLLRIVHVKCYLRLLLLVLLLCEIIPQLERFGCLFVVKNRNKNVFIFMAMICAISIIWIDNEIEIATAISTRKIWDRPFSTEHRWNWVVKFISMQTGKIIVIALSSRNIDRKCWMSSQPERWFYGL